MATPEQLVRAVSNCACVAEHELTGHTHTIRGRYTGTRDVIILRQTIQFVLCVKTKFSYVQLAQRLGFDHSTLIHNRKAVLNFLSRRHPEYLAAYRLVISCWVALCEADRRAARWVAKEIRVRDAVGVPA